MLSNPKMKTSKPKFCSKTSISDIFVPFFQFFLQLELYEHVVLALKSVISVVKDEGSVPARTSNFMQLLSLFA